MTCQEEQNLVIKRSNHQVDIAKVNVSLSNNSFKTYEAKTDERKNKDSHN